MIQCICGPHLMVVESLVVLRVAWNAHKAGIGLVLVSWSWETPHAGRTTRVALPVLDYRTMVGCGVIVDVVAG